MSSVPQHQQMHGQYSGSSPGMPPPGGGGGGGAPLMSSSDPNLMYHHPPGNGTTLNPHHQGPPEYLMGHPSTPPLEPSSLPWTVGSTDGQMATMALMQRQQQQKPPPPHPGSWNGQSGNLPVDGSPPNHLGSNGNDGSVGGGGGGGGAPIGETGEATATNNLAQLAAVQAGKSLYHDRLFHQASAAVEAVLSASCEVMGFDIAEMWLRTGPKTHQLTNSHLRPTALEDSVRKELVDVYYGEKSSERTHRLSPALCKRAKDANDVVWVTAHTQTGEEALRCSISNVRTAVAVPVCHEASNTNITIIYFSIRR